MIFVRELTYLIDPLVSEGVKVLCKRNNIKFVALLPNATHLLQPLDVAYFYSMKSQWQKVLDDWKETALVAVVDYWILDFLSIPKYDLQLDSVLLIISSIIIMSISKTAYMMFIDMEQAYLTKCQIWKI